MASLYWASGVGALASTPLYFTQMAQTSIWAMFWISCHHFQEILIRNTRSSKKRVFLLFSAFKSERTQKRLSYCDTRHACVLWWRNGSVKELTKNIILLSNCISLQLIINHCWVFIIDWILVIGYCSLLRIN